jgi:hypothetical protein
VAGLDTLTQDTKVKTTFPVNGIPINGSITNSLNATEQTNTITTEASIGLDQGKVSANAYVNVSSSKDFKGGGHKL